MRQPEHRQHSTMAAAKTEMLPSALQISDQLGFPYSPMDSYPKLEEMMLLHSAGTPFLAASAPEGVGFGTGEPGDSYNHLTGDALHDISIGCDKSLMDQTYSTPRLPSISYTGRFTLEPANSCSNSLWAEPLYSLVSGLMGMSQPPTSAAPCSSAAPVSSSSNTMSWPGQIGDTSPTYCSVSPDLFPDSNQSFPSPSNSSVQYPPPSYPSSKTCSSNMTLPMIPDYLFPSAAGLLPPDQKPFQCQSIQQQLSLTPLSTIKAFATQTGSQDLKGSYQSQLVKPGSQDLKGSYQSQQVKPGSQDLKGSYQSQQVKPSRMRKYPNRQCKTPPHKRLYPCPLETSYGSPSVNTMFSSVSSTFQTQVSTSYGSSTNIYSSPVGTPQSDLQSTLSP
ncbi:unnamed protein product [Coregonus sp. 'balchen']|nr:unnamed protein product [Coregonus sp. 'balchen']